MLYSFCLSTVMPAIDLMGVPTMFLHRIFKYMKHNNDAFLWWSNMLSLTPCPHRMHVQRVTAMWLICCGSQMCVRPHRQRSCCGVAIADPLSFYMESLPLIMINNDDYLIQREREREGGWDGARRKREREREQEGSEQRAECQAAWY